MACKTGKFQNGAPESSVYGMQDWEARHDLPVSPRPVIVCNCKSYCHIPAEQHLASGSDNSVQLKVLPSHTGRFSVWVRM